MDDRQYGHRSGDDEDAVVDFTDDDHTKNKTTNDEGQEAKVALDTLSNLIENMTDMKRIISEGLEAKRDHAALQRSYAVLREDHATLQENFDNVVQDKHELTQDIISYDSHIGTAQKYHDKAQMHINRARQSLRRRLSYAEDDLQPQTSHSERAGTTRAQKRARLSEVSPPRPKPAHGGNVNRSSVQIKPAVQPSKTLLGKSIDVRAPAASPAMQAQSAGHQTGTALAPIGEEKTTSTSGLQQATSNPVIPHEWYEDNDGMFCIRQHQFSSPELVARAKKAWCHRESLSGTDIFVLRNLRSVQFRTGGKKETPTSYLSMSMPLIWTTTGWYEDEAGMFDVRRSEPLSREVIDRVERSWCRWRSVSGTEVFELTDILQRGQTC